MLNLVALCHFWTILYEEVLSIFTIASMPSFAKITSNGVVYKWGFWHNEPF